MVRFLHLSALLAAIGTSALLHFAETRLLAADTIAAVRAWVGLIDNGARVFPLGLLALLVAGSYLVEKSRTLSSGWVVTALVGVAVQFVVGAGVVGGRVVRSGARSPTRARARLRRWRRDCVRAPGWRRLRDDTGLALGIVL